MNTANSVSPDSCVSVSPYFLVCRERPTSLNPPALTVM
jgi:hypothetical protein